MNKSARDVPGLVRAAEALEAEVRRLEALSHSIRRIRLDSGKNIARAGRELNQALKLPEELGATLLGLAGAMQDMQARQQAALDPLSAFAGEIQSRMARLEEHMQALAGLGNSAQRDEFPEVARDADALKQRLSALRRRLENPQSK